MSTYNHLIYKIFNILYMYSPILLFIQYKIAIIVGAIVL
jgi:hypothetical protein